MTDKEKAEEYLNQAKNLLSSRGFFSRIIGHKPDAEEAMKMYQKAGSRFKVAQLWKDAAMAYMAAAKIYENDVNEKFSTAKNFAEAGNCYRKESPADALKAYRKSIDIYIEMDKLSLAARELGICGEICEKDIKDKKMAIDFYQQAADLYRGEESKANSNKLLLKVAEFSAILEDYPRAFKIYEEIGRESLDNPLLKFGVKDHLFKACLVYLCYDLLESQIALKRYCDMSPSFKESREYNLINDIINSVEEGSIDQFEKAVKTFDSISRMDPWSVTMLLRLKKPMEGFMDLT